MRLTDKTVVTTLLGTEFAGVFTAAADKIITWANALIQIRNWIIATPDKIVITDATQTFTNKTLTSPKINENVALTPTSSDLNVLLGADAAGITPTKIGYLNDVTGDIQAQIDQIALNDMTYVTRSYLLIFTTGVGETTKTIEESDILTGCQIPTGGHVLCPMNGSYYSFDGTKHEFVAGIPYQSITETLGLVHLDKIILTSLTAETTYSLHITFLST